MVSTFCWVGKEGKQMKELMNKIEIKWYESKLYKKLMDYKLFRKYIHKHHHMRYTKKRWGNLKYIQFTDDISVVVCFDKNKEKGYIVSTLLLRSMMRAAYRHENLGHFGLALPFYCHFTSPIRRYPDLLCHRALKAILHGQDTGKLSRKVRRAALVSSEREEAAQEAEREAVRFYMCRYMEAHIGESFDAVISSVQEFGFFVALPNLVEGLVHVKDLGDDYYIYDGKALTLTGKTSGTRFCLGDRVRVRLSRVDSFLSHIDFEVTEAMEDGKNHCTK